MPNENPPPPSFFAEIETVLHALSPYGAAGIAGFGYAIRWLIGVDIAGPGRNEVERLLDPVAECA